MTTLNEIKAQKEAKVSQLITASLMFFAFSTQQFTDNKTTLQDGEKYVSLGIGAYMPKGKVDTYLNGMKEINKWYKATIKNNKVRKENILYELNNHEAFYTGDINDTLSTLGSDYTYDEVLAVYREARKTQSVEF